MIPSAFITEWRARAPMKHEGNTVSRAEFEANLYEKLTDKRFLEDIHPLLKTDTKFDVKAAGETFKNRTLSLLSGEPWAGLKEKKK